MAAKYTAKTLSEIIFSDELNNLPDRTRILSAVFNNVDVSQRFLYGNFSISISETAQRTGTNLLLSILPEINGEYVSGGISVTPEDKYNVGEFTFDKSPNAKIDMLEKVHIPNSNFKVLLTNQLGVPLGMGNLLVFEKYSLEDIK